VPVDRRRHRQVDLVSKLVAGKVVLWLTLGVWRRIHQGWHQHVEGGASLRQQLRAMWTADPARESIIDPANARRQKLASELPQLTVPVAFLRPRGVIWWRWVWRPGAKRALACHATCPCVWRHLKLTSELTFVSVMPHRVHRCQVGCQFLLA
jgi:hypothetical protein